MNTHKNARLSLHGRVLLVRRVLDEGLRAQEVAQAQGVSVRPVYKWLNRFRQKGYAGLEDRTSRPAHSLLSTDADTVGQIIERRQQRQTYLRIAQALGGSLRHRSSSKGALRCAGSGVRSKSASSRT